MAAAERVEIVHETADSDDVASSSIEPAFTSAPLVVGDDRMDTAEAPVMDAGEMLHRDERSPVPPPSPVSAITEAERPPESPKEAPAHAIAESQESEAAKTGATIPEPKLVTEKPANPKRGWWQRLIDS
jgi:hypothetical protein